jgi:hypothetical protein
MATGCIAPKITIDNVVTPMVVVDWRWGETAPIQILMAIGKTVGLQTPTTAI